MDNSVIPVDQLLNLRGSTAVVTGASGGIGSAIAIRLAEAGARVAVHCHNNTDGAKIVADKINQKGGTASVIAADLCSEHDCEDLLAQTKALLGVPTALVNNAGAQPVSSLLHMSATEIEQVLSTNVNAPIVLTRLFAALHTNNHTDAPDRNISVTNIASIEGLQPAIGHSHYASSKSALIMFTRAAAVELGEYGIRVNAVSPGLINREGLTDNWPEGVNRYNAAAPLGTIGENTDIANAVLFLSSPAARWVSGSNLVVDGGVACAPVW